MEALLSGVKQDDCYISELIDKLTHLVISASRAVFSAGIGYGAVRCGNEKGIGGNRRDPINGPCDPFVYTMTVKDDRDEIRCFFINYAVHPTVLHADNTHCSADYPGAIRRCLRVKFPHSVTVFNLGASGDQSTRYFRNAQSFDEAERIGGVLADAVAEAAQNTVYTNLISICAASLPYYPPFRKFPLKSEAEERVKTLKSIYEALINKNSSYLDRQNANLALLGAEDMLGYILLGDKINQIELVRDELPASVTAVSVGDISLLMLPGEVFVGIALEIRKRTNDTKLIITTLADGCLPGYCYTPDEITRGGYEVDTSLLAHDAGTKLIETALAALAKLSC